MTDASADGRAARYLAEAGRVLERFDPRTSLQAILELAVPALADVGFIHLATAIATAPTLAAAAHRDPDTTAELATRLGKLEPIRAETAVSRVLAGGPPELVLVDDEVLADAARDPDHLAAMRGRGYRCAVVAPLAGREGVLGAVTFSLIVPDRSYGPADLAMLVELARRTGIALDNHRLFLAERQARLQAEAARMRERQLHLLASRLSTALTTAQVAVIVSEGAMSSFGAYAALAALRSGDVLKTVGAIGARNPELLAQISMLPLSAPMPLAEAVRTGEIVWCADRDEIAARYPQSPELARHFDACGAVPFSFEGRTVGALAVACDEPGQLTSEHREMLTAIGQLAAQAFERARLYEALCASEDQLRDALRAARAGTWVLDLRTMTSKRDASYAALLALEANDLVNADFGHVHPDDREITRAAFERALREGVPYDPECRIQCGDGRYRWFRSFARVLEDASGEPTVMTGLVFDIDDSKRAALAADEERRINETLHRLGASFASELDHDRLVKLITDEVAREVGAEVATFSTRDDAERDRIASMASFLAIPVVARTGETYGSLLFGHSMPGMFTAHHDRLAASIARQAAIALENARLYQEVRHHEKELEVAVERARVADGRKDEFLAMLGHELRNPLAPIATALDLMDLKGTSVHARERDVIRRQVHHMTRLVDDLLDVSRITRGKIELTKHVLELGGVIARAIEMASPLLEKRMQRLAIDVPREGLLVDADAQRLAQVFQNLLTNAAKYSEPQTEITIRARRVGEEAIIEVIDQGLGIAPELMPRLFELFVQGERAIDRAEGGLGLGLTIAKSLCDLHGGSIEATSAGPGRGSTFTVRLPLVPADTVAAADRTTVKMPKLARGARVLVVDDNADTAAALQEYLRDLGHEPAIAHDGVAALELLATFRPEVAVLDIGLPVMDGYELARRLREKLGADKVRLIALTGYGHDADRARANEAGFDHALVKPIALDALTELIDRVR